MNEILAQNSRTFEVLGTTRAAGTFFGSWRFDVNRDRRDHGESNDARVHARRPTVTHRRLGRPSHAVQVLISCQTQRHAAFAKRQQISYCRSYTVVDKDSCSDGGSSGGGEQWCTIST